MPSLQDYLRLFLITDRMEKALEAIRSLPLEDAQVILGLYGVYRDGDNGYGSFSRALECIGYDDDDLINKYGLTLTPELVQEVCTTFGMTAQLVTWNQWPDFSVVTDPNQYFDPLTATDYQKSIFVEARAVTP